ncbi:hypothetical protein [Streptomyces sp. NPDC051109]|uniref:hypothetical protein n=1 Tax=Streptomyces sp. NPDC051109 TaxID=3365642 RepID=UPI0010656058
MALAGFRAKQTVTIQRVGGGRSSTTSVSPQGSLTVRNLRDGTYTIKRQGHSTIPCKDAPAPVTVDITDADVVATKPNTPTVKCNQATPVTFEGTLTGTGTGDIRIAWFNPDTGKRSERTMKFTGPTSKTAEFVVTAPARANPTEPRPTVKVQLVVPRQGSEQGVSSAVLPVTLVCETGT